MWTVFRGGTAVPLLAGAGADYTSTLGGTFAFDVDALPSDAWTPWDVGSANKYSLLVRALTALLPLVVLLRLIWAFLRRGRGGSSVPLFAGASASTPVPLGGALTFIVVGTPWWTGLVLRFR